MAKAKITTEERIGKFLFDSLTSEQKKQMQKVIERTDVNLDPPTIKVDNSWDAMMVDIKLIPGSYKD